MNIYCLSRTDTNSCLQYRPLGIMLLVLPKKITGRLRGRITRKISHVLML